MSQLLKICDFALRRQQQNASFLKSLSYRCYLRKLKEVCRKLLVLCLTDSAWEHQRVLEGHVRLADEHQKFLALLSTIGHVQYETRRQSQGFERWSFHAARFYNSMNG